MEVAPSQMEVAPSQMEVAPSQMEVAPFQMEVAPFFVDFHHFLSIFTIFCRFSPFFIDFHDLRTFVAIYILSRFTHFFRKFFLAKIAISATSHVFCMYGHTLFGKSVKMSPVQLPAGQIKSESFLLQHCFSMHCKSKWQMFIQSVLRHHGFNSGASNSFQETM